MDRLERVAGTPLYMAPEVVNNTGYNHQCDIWSIGVLFYLLLLKTTGKERIEGSFLEMTKNGKIEYSEPEWEGIPMQAKQLCEIMLRFDPAKRGSAGELISHPGLSRVIISNVKQRFLKDRDTTRKVKQHSQVVMFWT
jgi:serine/threonine protein kinase